MRLTHHHAPTRSLIIIVIVVLATVYTAFILLRLQQQSVVTPAADKGPEITQNSFDTNDWQNYIDRSHPLEIRAPKNWAISEDDSYSGFYAVNLDTKNSGDIKIFISETGFAGITNPTGSKYKTNQGVEVTKHDDWLYTAKVGDYYYTFDATLGVNLEQELSEIVRLAKFN